MKQDWRIIALVVLIVSLVLASQCEAAKGKGKRKDKSDGPKEEMTTPAPEGAQEETAAGEGGESDSPRQSSKSRRCKQKCRNANSPVCGTDLITYQYVSGNLLIRAHPCSTSCR